MYKNIPLIHGGAFPLLHPLSLEIVFPLFNSLLVFLFLLTVWNCYLTYRINKTVHVILPYSYALKYKQS